MATPPSFPNLAGQGWSTHKKPLFNTIVADHVSGREVRYANYQYPLWEFELTFEGLTDLASPPANYANLGASSLQSLMGLFLQSQGQFGTFLYADPTDDAVTAQAIATGDGATETFTLVRSLGGFSEPVGWVTDTPSVYLNAAAIPAAGFSPPATPSLSSSAAGALSGTTYYVKITYVTASGETLASTEASLAVASSHVLGVASPAAPSPASAAGWNVYVSTTAGTETKQNGSTPIAIGTGWTEPTSGLVSGAALPGANTTGWSLSTPNSLVFAGAPSSAVAITASFTYAFQCRFSDDNMDFEQFMSGLWKVDGVKFETVRSS